MLRPPPPSTLFPYTTLFRSTLFPYTQDAFSRSGFYVAKYVNKKSDMDLARSEERFSRNAETDLVCRLLLEKKNCKTKAKTTRKQTTTRARSRTAIPLPRSGV